MDSETIAPDFSNSLVNIPHTILEHFGAERNKSIISDLLNGLTGSSQVVLLLADGLGFNLLSEQKNFLAQANAQSGMKLTTVFPSSTPPAITSLNTGLTPQEHGLLEWNMFMHELDMILEVFPYRRADALPSDDDVLVRDKSLLYDGPTLFEKLVGSGVESYYFVARPNHLSLYTQATARGATVKSFDSLGDLFQQLVELININSASDKKVYYYIHWGSIDKAAHEYGPGSPKVKEAIDLLSGKLDGDFFDQLSARARTCTTLVLTADHGHVPVEPQNAVYLNDFPEITDHFKRTNTGATILPTGGARSVFLAIEDSEVEEVVNFINTNLRHVARAVAVDSNSIPLLFGGEAGHEKFLSRLGNVIILPKSYNTVWYKYHPSKELTEKGDHGGLSPEEMYIPCIVLNASKGLL